jgi:hypothetical protein
MVVKALVAEGVKMVTVPLLRVDSSTAVETAIVILTMSALPLVESSNTFVLTVIVSSAN